MSLSVHGTMLMESRHSANINANIICVDEQNIEYLIIIQLTVFFRFFLYPRGICETCIRQWCAPMNKRTTKTQSRCEMIETQATKTMSMTLRKIVEIQHRQSLCMGLKNVIAFERGQYFAHHMLLVVRRTSSWLHIAGAIKSRKFQLLSFACRHKENESFKPPPFLAFCIWSGALCVWRCYRAGFPSPPKHNEYLVQRLLSRARSLAAPNSEHKKDIDTFAKYVIFLYDYYCAAFPLFRFILFRYFCCES